MLLATFLEPIAAINFWEVFVAIVIILLALKGLIEIIQWFKDKLGLQTKWSLKEKKEDEVINSHDTMLKELTENFTELSKNVKHISESFTQLQNSSQETANEMVKIKEQVDIITKVNQSQLYDRLEQKTKYYRDILQGIPADERVGYKLLLDDYKAVGGNHGMDVMVQDALDTLPPLPSGAVPPLVEE